MTQTQHVQEAHPAATPTVFYVGGQYIQDAQGTHHMTGQMCVRRYGTHISGQPAIIYIHGASQTGTHFESTPDDRPGLAVLQASSEWECFVVDQPGIGRSRYHAADMGELTHYSAEELQKSFTSPDPNAWPSAKLHTQWPGTGRIGDPIFDAFYASQVGHIKDYRTVETLFRRSVRALLQRTGPAFLITHSQSGPLGWHAADECPELVRGIVALEPHGPPFAYPDIPPFSSMPDMVGKLVHPFGVTTTPLTYDPPLPVDASGLPFVVAGSEEGDHVVGDSDSRRIWRMAPVRRLPNLTRVPVLLITAEASYHAMYDHLTAEFLRDAGVPVEHIYLADVGIRGNGHLMAIEKNNQDIQNLIGTWLAARCSYSG